MDICNEFFKGDTRSMVTACEWVLIDNMSDAAPRPPITQAAVEAILTMQMKVQNWHKIQTDPSPWVVELCELLDSYSLEDKSLIEIGFQILAGAKPTSFPIHEESPSIHPNVNPVPTSSRPANSKRKADVIDLDDDDRVLNDDSFPFHPTTSYRTSDDFASQLSRTPSLSWSNSTDVDEDFDLTRPTKRHRSETSSPELDPPLALTNSEIPPMQEDICPQAIFGGDITPTHSSFTFSLPWDLQNTGYLQDLETTITSSDQSSDPQSLQQKRTWTDVDLGSFNTDENKTEQSTAKRRRLSNVVDSEESLIISLPEFIQVPRGDHNPETHSTQHISQPPLNFPLPEISSEELDSFSKLLQQLSEAPTSVCLPGSTELLDGTTLVPTTPDSNIEVGQTEFEMFNWENLMGFFCPENEDSALQSANGNTIQIANDFLQLPFSEEDVETSNFEAAEPVEPEILEIPSLVQEPSSETPSIVLNDIPQSNLFLDELLCFSFPSNQPSEPDHNS